MGLALDPSVRDVQRRGPSAGPKLIGTDPPGSARLEDHRRRRAAPGLNAVIPVIVRKGVAGDDFLGVTVGGGPSRAKSRPLGVPEVRGILPRGGTILCSSRTNPIKQEGGVEQIVANLERDGVDGLIAIGGEDTLGVAAKPTTRA